MILTKSVYTILCVSNAGHFAVSALNICIREPWTSILLIIICTGVHLMSHVFVSRTNPVRSERQYTICCVLVI